MSRRSSRNASKKEISLPDSVLRGLTSLVQGNESTIAKMLSLSADTSSDAKELVKALKDCMGVNNLSAEALLARFFDSSLLGEYCKDRLGKSGKGNEATLAARIACEWARPSFEPIERSESVDEGKDEKELKEEPRPLKKKQRVMDYPAKSNFGTFTVDRKSPSIIVTDACGTVTPDFPGSRPEFELCLVGNGGKRFSVLQAYDEGGKRTSNEGSILYKQGKDSHSINELPGKKLCKFDGDPMFGPDETMYDLTPARRKVISGYLQETSQTHD